MNLIGIDTSSENISLGIVYKGKPLVDYNLKKPHSASHLVSCLDRHIKKYSLDLKKINAFILGKGPGSFTGLRISFSVVKALSLVLKKPVIPVASLYLVALNIKNRDRIAVIADARRGLIYGASFKRVKGRLRIEAKERLLNLEDFIPGKEEHCFITSDIGLRDKALDINPNLEFKPKAVYPKLKAFWPEFAAAKDSFKAVSLDKLEPLYLHPKTCQVRNA